MTRSIGLAHIRRHDDGVSTGMWANYEICSGFQPIFRFEQGKLNIAAFEGLVRPFKNGQPVSPGAFFKSIPAQDALEIETLTRTLHLLNAGRFLDPNTSLFVNFDPSVYNERATADRAMREMRLTLHEAEIDPDRIVCEVTEHSVSSQKALHDFVDSLREHGFRIAVDDYGAEDSDMNRVRELRPEIVKFDAKWITDLMDVSSGHHILETMVETFNSWNITTLFEGIEEPWQLELAEKCGVSLVQGFVLARPELAPTQFAVRTREPERQIDITKPADEPVVSTAHEVKPAEAPVTRNLYPAQKAVKTFGRRVSNTG